MTNRHQPVLSRGTPTSTEEAMGAGRTQAESAARMALEELDPQAADEAVMTL